MNHFHKGLQNKLIDLQCDYYDASYNMEKTHYHDYYELYYRILGDRYMFINEKFLHLNPGDLLWFNKYDLHQSFQGDKTNGIRSVLYFTEDYIKNIFGEDANKFINIFNGAFKVMSFDNIQHNKFLDLIYELEQAIQTNQELYAQFIFGQLILVLEDWTKKYKNILTKEADINPTYERISNVLTYLNYHCLEKITLDHVAKQFFVSPFYLSRTFKSCTGISFVKYVNHLKIEKAKQFLKQEKSVTQVSLKIGFENITHFERVFKSITGYSPKAWQKNKIHSKKC